MKEIYLDNAATTRVSDAAAAAMQEMLTGCYGNPSSLHAKGYEAEKRLKEARQSLADMLRVDKSTVLFTSCATESTNTALRYAARSMRHQGRKILCSKGEHSATLETLAYLANEGFEIETIDNDSTGRILLESLAEKLDSNTILVTCLMVNNETGCIQPIAEMAKLIKEKKPDCLFHVDAVQAFGKLPIYPSEWGVDFLSVSAHKINGPKGTGLLYVRKGLALKPLMFGGGQESGLRSGTENTAGIVGFATAASELYAMRGELLPKLAAYKKKLVDGIVEALPDVFVNGPSVEDGAPYIVNLRFDNVRSEVLLHSLEDYGIYISSGSACSSNKPQEKSPTLASLGLNAKQIDQSVRFSFGRYTTEEDIDETVRALKQIVPMLRKFSAR